MEDVMTSLQDMGLSRGFASSPDVSPEPYQTWSSQEFDAQDSSRPTTPGRPQTKDSWKANGSGAESTNAASATAPFDRTLDGPPQLNNYVQRMESRLRQLHAQDARKGSDELHLPRRTEAEDTVAPLPPSTRSAHMMYKLQEASAASKMAKRRSAYDVIGRSSTTRSDGTSSSNGMHSTITFSSTSSRTSAEHSLMSGMSAGAYSATSAGSFAKRSFKRPNTSMDIHTGIPESSESPIAVKSDRYNESPSRQGASSAIGWTDSQRSTPARDSLKKKSGFFRKMIESAKSTAANARSARAPGSMSPAKSRLGSAFSHSRSVTPSKLELIDRAERCQMMDFPVIYAIEDLYATAEGDEGIDGLPIEEPAKWAANNFGLVDKNARLLNSFPPNLSPASLAQSHVCRPHKTDLQRLRAIFTWVAEKIIWEEDIDEEVDVRRIVQIRRGSAREVAVLVQEMCAAVGLHCEVVAGHLKTPGEDLDLDCISFPNHFWNTILIDGEWRIMDCSLASPTHPSRGLYSNAHPHMAESWYFLVRPMEICYSHVPLSPEHQHIVPPVATDVLLALPAVTPAYFQCGLTFASYDTSLTRIDGLEAVQIRVEAPFDIEVAAEVETQALPVNVEGQLIQTGETRTKRALSQPDWCQGRKRYTLKAVLPESDDHGVLKVYAGKRGLMHSSKDIPYPLAFALPIVHTGDNPPYDFVLRHPTPHAQQRDLYILQPQCAKLSINNTFVFTVRQHPASLFPAMPAITTSGSFRTASPLNRPPSSLSMVSSVANYSTTSSTPSSAQQALLASSSNLSSNSSGSHVRKPAKLAIQSPSGKIMRLTRKMDNINGSNVSEQPQEPDGSLWETVIKIGERGTWRALVLADTSNKWCVWAEWEAV
ncbi:cytokinesis protein 3 [Ascosphaera acerosa]|nr:cytokinesis protein 3 [Ascosphaera acerosa]